jgi:uncharacterized protein YbcC (UPF0753/DUF2309 family)
LLDRKKITLKELIEFELLMELDALNDRFGNKWQPLSQYISEPPLDLLAAVPKTEFAEVIELWQDAFEWSYYDSVLKGILLASAKPSNYHISNNGEIQPKSAGDSNKISFQDAKRSGSFQAIFCIDEREDSIRRHIEAVAKDCETFGAPGFFGVEFYFQQEGSKFYDKLCPAPVTPKYLIKEFDATEQERMSRFIQNSLTDFLLVLC